MTVTLAKWTIEQYHQMIEAGVLEDVRVELLNGEIVNMPSEGAAHAHSNIETADLLRLVLINRAKIRESHPITLPESGSEPEPDIAVVKLLGEVYRDRHPYPEEVYLVIENSYSSLDKDKELKRQIYAQAGIPEYWIINLQDHEVIVHRDPVDGDYRSVQTLTSGNITLLAFPDVTIDIADLI